MFFEQQSLGKSELTEVTSSVVFTVTFSASPAVLWQSLWAEITMHLSDGLRNALCIPVLNL